MALLITNMTFDEYNKLIAKAVIKNIDNKLGNNASQTINIYLKRYNLNLNHICKEPDKIREALYNMFGIAAYRIEYEIIRCIYDVLGLKIISLIHLKHAINIAKTYFKLIHDNNIKDEIDNYIELINIEDDPKCCKSCNKSFDIKNPYEGFISELCSKCYFTYTEIVYNNS